MLLCPLSSPLLYVRVLKWRPWNLEFGSPPSTLSCHLSLKNEYEEKYTATSVQGSERVCEEEEVGHKGGSRHPVSAEATVPQGDPVERRRRIGEVGFCSSCRDDQWCQGHVRRKKPPTFPSPALRRRQRPWPPRGCQGDPQVPHVLHRPPDLRNVKGNCCLPN